MHQAVGSKATVSRQPHDKHEAQPSPAVPQANEAAVWQIFFFNWRLLGAISGVVVAVLVTTEFRIAPFGYLVVFAIAMMYWKFGRRHFLTLRWNPRVSFALMAIGQFVFALSIMTTLTYLATAIGLPLQDKRLLTWDLALGMDFRWYLHLANRYPQMMRLLAPSYGSITWQLVVVAVGLPLFGYYRRVAEAVCAFTLSLLATTCISALVPAIGVYDTLGLTPADYPYFVPGAYYDTARDAPLVRSGSLRLLDLPRLVGVLTFPSFHAVAAILYIWAFWPIMSLRLLAVPWNAAMMAATPLGGGHYFIDIWAGIVVALAALGAARRIGDFFAPPVSATQTTAIAAGGEVLPPSP